VPSYFSSLKTVDNRSFWKSFVNFINILRAAFAPIFFCTNNYKIKLQLEKSCAKDFQMMMKLTRGENLKQENLKAHNAQWDKGTNYVHLF